MLNKLTPFDRFKRFLEQCFYNGANPIEMNLRSDPEPQALMSIMNSPQITRLPPSRAMESISKRKSFSQAVAKRGVKTSFSLNYPSNHSFDTLLYNQLERCRLHGVEAGSVSRKIHLLNEVKRPADGAVACNKLGSDRRPKWRNYQPLTTLNKE
ncbi:hypothetical protein NPIL_168071 [Nephila pilipes]|uniref:Uncharacterized protein n=1 Tax=Nephila pilipes TaxID=299642 RepID=A0A8X6T6R8_NEPPI|nr:hypothetical protein NPIL_168071 [Nephila pilipes]